MTMPSGAEDLRWGTGPRTFEVFLEPTCPFSGKAFNKLMSLIDSVGDEFQVAVRLNPQPWHTFSSPICRAILASALGDNGKTAAFDVMRSVFANREEFILHEHREGPNMALSPATIISRLEELSGVEIAPLFARSDVTQDLKWHTRFGRQNGVHSTPSFMVDGLLTEKLSSGQTVEEWKDFLDAN